MTDNAVLLGDCVEVMAGMEPESVDAIVTDPPYGLEFMGKEWDKIRPTHGNWNDSKWEGHGLTQKQGGTATDRPMGSMDVHPSITYTMNRKCRLCGKWQRGAAPCSCDAPSWEPRPDYRAQGMQRWHQQWAEAAYRVAKPSAYLLAFGGTRTVHRMTVALEDAGWIIRDMLVWAYASGFPKSKASLKPAWEPIVMARKPGPLRMLAIDECRIPLAGESDYEFMASRMPAWNRKAEWEGAAAINVGPRSETPPDGRWPANVILTDPIFDGGVDGVVGGGGDVGAHGGPPTRSGARALGYGMSEDGDSSGYGDSGAYSRFFLIPKSSRDDREPTLYPFCTCETVKLSAWERRSRNQPARTVSTSRARATSEASTTADSDSSTTLFGSSTSDPSPLDSRSTTSTETSETTGSRTSKPSIASPTNGSTPAASSSMASGGSGAPSAATTESSNSPTGTSLPKAGPSTDGAGPATSARSSRPSVCAECGKEVMPSRAARINAHPT